MTRATHRKRWPARTGPWAYWLLFSIHIADDLVRTGFMIFLPFLLRDKGRRPADHRPRACRCCFAGRRPRAKLVMGWVGDRLGVVPVGHFSPKKK